MAWVMVKSQTLSVKTFVQFHQHKTGVAKEIEKVHSILDFSPLALFVLSSYSGFSLK